MSSGCGDDDEEMGGKEDPHILLASDALALLAATLLASTAST